MRRHGATDAAGPAASKRGEAGFTLPELAIASLLLLLGLAWATQLLLESQRLLIRTAIESTRSSETLLAEAFVRRDVLHAVRAMPGAGDELLLEFPGRARARYRIEDGCLGRSVAEPDEDFADPRCLLPEVLGWSWQAVSARRVDVQIAVADVDVGAGAALISDLRLRPPGMRPRIVRFSAAMRAGGPRRGRW